MSKKEHTLWLLRGGGWFGQTVLLNLAAGDLADKPVKILALNDKDQVEVEFSDGQKREVPPDWLWLSIRDEFSPLLNDARLKGLRAARTRRRSRGSGSSDGPP